MLKPEVNRPVVILSIGWLLSALHGVADDSKQSEYLYYKSSILCIADSNTILMNLYGDASAGKTTLVKILTGVCGTSNLLRCKQK